MFELKRVYEPPTRGDGFRVLVERLWPRGISKDKAALDLWLKEIAPSTELRTWFGHDPAKWKEFQTRYSRELGQKPDLVCQLRQQAERGTVTLVYAAHDREHNAAVVLKAHLERET
jgi:uncharacterized protein YeaO (DUF488 family)